MEPAAARRDWLWLLPLLLAPLLIAGCWRGPFLTLDDIPYIQNDPRLSPEAPWSAVFSHRPGYPFYYPLTMLSWRLDRVVWTPLLEGIAGECAWSAGVRLTNLLLHLGGAVLLWLTLRGLGASGALAGFVAAAFALHPAACESVCWPVERKNVLAAFFCLLALWQYARATRWWEHAPALLAFAAALLAKPSALGLFPIVAVWEILGRPGLDGVARTAGLNGWKGVALRLTPWAALAVAGTALGFAMHEENVIPPPGGSVFTALLTDIEILARYVKNFLWPETLSAYYCVVPIVSFADARLYLYGLPLALLVAGTFAACRPEDRRACAFGWLWFAGALGPNLNLVGINDLMHDRFVYLSAPGLWLVLGLALKGLAGRLFAAPKVLPRWAAPAVLAGVALAWSFAGYARGELFSLAAKLFEDAVRKEPHSSYARIFLAADYRVLGQHRQSKGDKNGAEEMFALSFASLEAGIKAPDFDRYLHKARAFADLAQEYLMRRRPELAAQYALAALAADRRTGWDNEALGDAHRILGTLDLAANRLDQALLRCDEALRLVSALHSARLLRVKTLHAIAKYWTGQGDSVKAAAALDEARQDIRRLPEVSSERAEAKALLEERP